MKDGPLRLSVTDRCNFRCRYCIPAGGIHNSAHLPIDELADLAAWLAQWFGIERVKLTGGEPLLFDLADARRERGDNSAAGELLDYLSGKHMPGTMDSPFSMNAIGG